MASEAVRRRARVRAASTVARARREKMALALGILVLAGLLALEGPKTLRSLQGASPAPAPATTTTATASHKTAATASSSLEEVSRFSVKDPFAQQLTGNGTPSAGPTHASGPRVRTSHFVPKDPFKQQLLPPTSAASTAVPVTPPKVLPPKPAARMRASEAKSEAKKATKMQSLASLGSGTVVIVASVPVAQGQAAAKKVAAQARSRGVTNVHVALSSASKTPRTRYFAVYAGPYSTSTAAVKELGSVRKAGYASAYTRHLGH